MKLQVISSLVLAGLLVLAPAVAPAGQAGAQATPPQPAQPQAPQPQAPQPQGPQPQQPRRPQPRQGPQRDTARPEPARGTASLTGAIVAADTGLPVKRARVVASAAQAATRVAFTDNAGKWELKDLPAGRYTVTVARAGFVTVSFGQRRPFEPAMPLTLEDGQRLERVDLRLPRGGVITGRVADEAGDAQPGVVVSVMREAFRQGERTLLPAGTDLTDDRGEYRVFGLPPGEYVVSATLREGGRPFAGPMGMGPGGMMGPGGGAMAGGGPAGRFFFRSEEANPDEEPSMGYAPTYYPGTAAATEAGRVDVGLSQESAGIDFSLQLVPLARISGRVSATGGVTPRNVVITLMPDGVGVRRGGGGTRMTADGGFSVDGIAPGRYRLMARGLTENDTPYFATIPISVAGADMAGLSVTLTPGGELSGTIVAASTGGQPLPALDSLRVTARPMARQSLGGDGSSRVEADGRFTLRGLSADPRMISVSGLPRAWTVRSVQIGARDATDQPVEINAGQRLAGVTITLTDRLTEISGAVRGADGQPSVDGTVIVFPSDPELWIGGSRRLEATRPDQTGRFVLRGLPAGDYLIAALDGVEQGEWQDPELLQRMRPSAQRLVIVEGETKAVDVQLSR